MLRVLEAKATSASEWLATVVVEIGNGLGGDRQAVLMDIGELVAYTAQAAKHSWDNIGADEMAPPLG